MSNVSVLRALMVLVVLTTFAGCGSTENKIGSTVKGTRVPILEQSKIVETDTSLQGMKPELPDPIMNATWPQAGYDATHVLPHTTAGAHPEEIWRADIGYGSDSDFKLLARPVLADGRIFTMDAQGLVSAFDIKTGDRIWEFDTTPEDRDENAIGGGLGVEGDVVFATTGFGEVLAIKAADGTVLWRRMLMVPLRAAPTIADNRVYAVSIDNQLQALDARTGEVLWHHNGIAEPATLMGASNPAVLGDSVVVAYSSGEIFNLRAENGRVSWNYALTSPTQVGALPAIADIRGLPVIDHGRVYAISHSGRMAAIDHRTGDRAWEVDIGGINTPLVAGNTVFVLSNDDHLVAIASGSGRVMWVHELQRLSNPDDHDSDPIYWVGPTMAGGRLWLTNSLGQLVSFLASDGAQADMIDLGEPSYIPPIGANNTIYIVTDNGKLIALR